MKIPRIEVVLPTYNGAAYLQAQLASIYDQTMRPERVLLRDDNSTDETQELVDKLQCRYGSWLQLLPADGNLGCIANVNRLLESSSFPYVALSDQDDIWLPHKLELSINKVRELESRYGKSTPLLVYSDLELADKSGNHLGIRYMQRQHLDPSRNKPQELSIANVVTGCTSLVNRSLLNLALPIHSNALMHDWWLALVCSCFGRLCYIDNPTVLYRQHSKNQLGSKGLSLHYFLTRGVELALTQNITWVYDVLLQTQSLETRYDIKISPLYDLLSLPRWKRIVSFIKLSGSSKPSRHGPARTAAFYFSLLSAKRTINSATLGSAMSAS